MAGIERKDMERSLKDKGFRPEEGKGHTRWFYWRLDPQTGRGLRTAINVMIGRGPTYRTYRDTLMRPLANELRLPTSKLARDFFHCPLQQAEYERLVGPGLGWDVPGPEV